MATYYVAKSGDDTNAGTSAGSPFLTFTKAFLSANANNDIVIINDSGVYYESAFYTYPRTGIQVLNGVDCSPILDGSATGSHGIAFYNTWTVRGITFRNFADNGLTGNGSDRTVTVLDCTFHDIGEEAIHRVDGGSGASTIRRCTFYDIDDAVIFFKASTSPNVINNLFYNCAGTAIYATGGSAVAAHNTVDSCCAGGSVPYAIYLPNGTAKYNIVTRNASTTAAMRVGTHTYNNSYNNTASTVASLHTNYYQGAGTGDLEVDPLYANGTAAASTDRDYSLQSTSPCFSPGNSSSYNDDINSPVATTSTVGRDWAMNGHNVLGVSSNNNHDMGCYEYRSKVLGVNTVDVDSIMDVDT